MLNINQTRLIR